MTPPPARDDPDEPVNLRDGQVQCDECDAIVPEEQSLTKRPPGDQPDIELCPACQ